MFVCLRLSPRFHGQLRHRLDCFEGVMLSQWLQKKKKSLQMSASGTSYLQDISQDY